MFQYIMHNGGNMPYNINEEIKQQIINLNDIVDVIEEFLPLKKNGTNYLSCCPFHSEKTPSFVVSKEKQFYHCFGCGKSGDVIEFLMEYKNMTYVESIEYLANRAGIKLEEIQYSDEKAKQHELEKKLCSINKDAAIYFHQNLINNKIPLEYLLKRNIDISIIKKFGLGYTVNEWDSLIKYLENKGHKIEEIEKTGLIKKRDKTEKYFDTFRNRIMFPIVDVKKRIIGFGGRVLDNSLPKYLNSRESVVFSKGNNMYALNVAKENVKDKSFYLVEGYMDVIKMHSYGFDTAVAALGTALTQNQINLLKRYSHNFYICFDSDTAGLKASFRAINMLKRSNFDAKVIVVENAKDPDEYLNKFGKTKFEMLTQNAMNYYEFLNFYFKNELKLTSKIEYINKFMENMVNVNSDIEKELIFEKLSLGVGVSRDSLMSEYRKKYVNKSNKFSNVRYNKTVNNIIKPLTIDKNSKNITHEKGLIDLILLNNDLALELSEIINDIDFLDYEYLNFFKEVYKARINKKDITVDFINSIEDKKCSVTVQEKRADMTEDKINSLFYDCYKRLKIRYLTNLQSNKNYQLTKINDYDLQKNILQDVMRIAKRIKSLKEEVS